MTIRELFVRLGIKTDPKGFQRAQQGIAAVRNSALSLGRVFLTGAVAYGFKRMLDVASDIEETANKFGAVFGDAGDIVQKQLDDIGRRTGATGMQLQEMSSNIGALIKPALGSAEAAGQMASSVAELALDISSFNNVTSEEALIALRSGLIGSAEPLQRFGVDVRVAALQQEALAQGITTSVQNMTEGQRVALRYAAIQKQLGMQGATGDATRTAKGFANASRNLWAALKEIVGVIMGFLLPAVTRLVNKSRVIIDRMQAWFRENKALVQQRVDKFIERFGRVVSATAKFFGRIIDATSEWYDGLGELGKALFRIGAIAAGLALVLLLPGGPILLLIALVGLLIEDFETWRAGGESVIGDIIAWFRQLDDVIVTGIMNTLDELSGAFDSLGKKIQQWGERNAVAFRLIQSLALGLTIIVGRQLVLAYGAAVLAHAKFYLWSIYYYTAIGAAAVKAHLLSAGAAIKSAAAWLAATAPLALTIVLVAVLVGTLIFLGSELIRLAQGKENFFSTMADGIKGLIEDWGGVGPAIGAMLDEALRYWLEFFGLTDKEVDEWVDDFTDTLGGLWQTIIGQWIDKFGEFFTWIGANVESFARGLGIDLGTPEGAQGPAVVPQTAQRAVAQPGGRGAQTMVDSSKNEFNFEVHQQPGQDERQLAEEFVRLVDQARQRELRQTSYDYALEGGT